MKQTFIAVDQAKSGTKDLTAIIVVKMNKDETVDILESDMFLPKGNAIDRGIKLKNIVNRLKLKYNCETVLFEQ